MPKEHTQYDPQMVWVDIETTTLEPETGSILELGITITDTTDLSVVDEAAWVISFDRINLANVSDWSIQQHYASGLLPACFTSELSPIKATVAATSWLKSRLHWTKKAVPMCGASIHFDRAWLKLHMPELEAFFYYGNFDVSTIEKVARWWWPSIAPWEDRGTHRALADNHDAIDELRYYARMGIVKLGPEGPGMMPVSPTDMALADVAADAMTSSDWRGHIAGGPEIPLLKPVDSMTHGASGE